MLDWQVTYSGSRIFGHRCNAWTNTGRDLSGSVTANAQMGSVLLFQETKKRTTHSLEERKVGYRPNGTAFQAGPAGQRDNNADL